MTNGNTPLRSGNFEETLKEVPDLYVKQVFEGLELVGLETRNKYSILDARGAQLGFAAEQKKGFFGAVVRQFLGHWRAFSVHIFDSQKQRVFVANHPFKLFFQRFEVFRASGEPLGILQQRFSILSRRFDLYNRQGRLLLQMKSPLFRIWTFKFFRNSQVEVGRVEKKWSGGLSEIFTDRDNFHVQFSHSLSVEERALILASSIFIDLLYFEKKAD